MRFTGFGWVLLLPLLFVGAGCLHTNYRGESFPATNAVRIVEREAAVPANYVAIGQGTVYGEASAWDARALEARMVRLAESKGAELVRIMGVVLIPEGRRINDEGADALEALDFDQFHTELSIDQDVASAGELRGGETFYRKMYAEFFRRK